MASKAWELEMHCGWLWWICSQFATVWQRDGQHGVVSPPLSDCSAGWFWRLNLSWWSYLHCSCAIFAQLSLPVAPIFRQRSTTKIWTSKLLLSYGFNRLSEVNACRRLPSSFCVYFKSHICRSALLQLPFSFPYYPSISAYIRTADPHFINFILIIPHFILTFH